MYPKINTTNRRKELQSFLFLWSLLLLTLNSFSQDTLSFSICVGDSITLSAPATDAYCSAPQSVSWSIGEEDLYTDFNPGYDAISDFTVAPTETTIYTAYSNGTSCMQESNWGFCGVGTPAYNWVVNGGIGPYPGAQGPAGPVSTTYYDPTTTIIEVEVLPCNSSQVSATGCNIPFSGQIFFEYCQGELFFLLEMSNGQVFDPYFAEGVDFVPYDGQLIHFNYEFADFDTPCGGDFEAVIITCIEEAEESMPIGNDVGITKITAPDKILNNGIQTVQARLMNLGSTVITTASMEWKVNGQPKQTYHYNGELYPGVYADINLGNEYFETTENYIIEVTAINPNGEVDAQPENDSQGRSFIGNPDPTQQNVLYMCKGESFVLQSASVSPTTDCYLGCTPGTSDCLTCSTVISPQLFTNCESGCSNFTVTPEHSIHYQVINECVNVNTGVCTSETVNYFVVVNECGESDAVGNCNYQKTGTIIFEDCGDQTFFYIEQSDGTVVDPYYAYGVAFEHYEGQIVAYDSSPATFDSPCGGNPAVMLTCIDEVDSSLGVDAGISRIVQPTYALEGEGMVILMIENYGTDPIYHTMVNWSLNGEAQNPIQYIAPDGAPLNPGDSTTVVANYFFSEIDYELAAYTSAPNALPDPNPSNDFSSVSLHVGEAFTDTLSWGTYYIDENTYLEGFETVINIPASGPGCNLPAIPTVTGGEWETKGGSLIFYPSETGSYFVTYAGSCDTYVFGINFIMVGEGRQLELDALLYGAYNENTGNMQTSLDAVNVISANQPFSNAPWFYNGTETYQAGILANPVDWVLVEIREGQPSLTEQATTVLETKAAIILSDGSVVDPANGQDVTFTSLQLGASYHVALRHRNHLDVLSANPVIIGEVDSYDFTTSIDQAFGPQQLLETVDGKFALYAGDFNGDGLVQTSDYDIWFAEPAAVNVYAPADGNLDAVVQSTDYDEWFVNKAKVGIAEIRLD